MHSIIIVAISVTVAALTLAGFGSSMGWSACLLAAGVALIGVPHGALDPIAGKRLFQDLAQAWWAPFFGAYIAAALLVVLGWYVIPTLTCLLFFALAAWHFGLEEDYATSVESPFLGHLFAISRGSLIIVAVSIFRPDETTAILSQVFLTGSVQQAALVVTCVQLSAVVLAPLGLVDLVTWWRAAAPGQLHIALRIAGMILLAAVVNPLLSFAVYFCAWHSARGLRELRAEVGGPLGEFVLRLVPLSIATLLLGLFAFSIWSTTEGLISSMIRTVFVGLSAIAIPHLALHTWYRLTFDSSAGGRGARGVALCS